MQVRQIRRGQGEDYLRSAGTGSRLGYLIQRQGSSSLLCCWACVSVLDILILIKNGKGKSTLNIFGEYNSSGREGCSMKDHTSFKGLTTFTLKIKQMTGNQLILVLGS